MNTDEYIDQGEKYLMHTYSRFPVVIDRGKGVFLYDTDGKKYLDFGAGIGVSALGYGDERLSTAIKEQADNVIHTSNLYYNKPQITAAEKLTKASGMEKVFFTNSGTEAVEGAIKTAKKYAYDRDSHANHEIIAMSGSFHGRTLGALSVTANEHYKEPFMPMIEGVRYAKFNDIESVKSKVTDKTCAIILEPIQGEGGIHEADQKFMEDVRKLCDDHDILLICDEVQCGMGRTGNMFCYMRYGITPDIVTCAKALGCGVPVGAFLASKKCAGSLSPGDHGSTYGGGPIAMAVVNKVFDIFKEDNILEHVVDVGGYLQEKLDEIVLEKTSVSIRRGTGLMQGLELKVPVLDVISKALDKGLLLLSAEGNTLRFLPPLIIEKNHVDMMISILRECL